MGRTSKSRLGTALPAAPEPTGGDGRLDPVRWRRPARGPLLRLAAVATLLGIAALTAWSPPPTCDPPAYTVSVSGPASPPASPVVPTGSMGVPVRLSDPAALALVAPGNRVDLLRHDEADGSTTPVAESALVLRVTAPDDPTTGGLLLALAPVDAPRAVAGPGQSFSVLIRPG
ncbi:hypothetical protein M1L60_18080 [Actinoplanes sp. TRM 88003]|uniref:SAF domain-containing protein n=1 Tax=Paractinoplanes aksuensis TaxID=2939490 RepID=A0ABT1DNT7_9ACTN|nr:hypothetical protein [Actinoplanes aksuensis]MCO8272506.1 hypothetical protein [Actinoplanes aksuensis]